MIIPLCFRLWNLFKTPFLRNYPLQLQSNFLSFLISLLAILLKLSIHCFQSPFFHPKENQISSLHRGNEDQILQRWQNPIPESLLDKSIVSYPFPRPYPAPTTANGFEFLTRLITSSYFNPFLWRPDPLLSLHSSPFIESVGSVSRFIWEIPQFFSYKWANLANYCFSFMIPFWCHIYSVDRENESKTLFAYFLTLAPHRLCILFEGSRFLYRFLFVRSPSKPLHLLKSDGKQDDLE